MKRLILLAIGCTLLALPAAAQNETKALSAFKKAFHTPIEQTGSIPAMRKAVDLLEEFDSLKVAKALVEAYAQTSRTIATSDEERLALEAEFAKIDEDYPNKNALPQMVFSRLKELRALIPQLRSRQDELEILRDSMLGKLQRIRDPKAIDWMVDRVIADKRMPFSLKLTVARAAARIGAETLEGMIRALSNAKRVEELAVLLDGLGHQGRAAAPAGEKIIKLLDHKSQSVRERAAWALSQIAVPEAIEPLLERLEKEKGRAQRHMAIALEVLTRCKIGVSVSAWKLWFQTEGHKYTSGQMELGGGESTLTTAASGGGSYYHGIPQDGQSIVYVIDCSGSMVISITNPKHEGRGPVPAEDKKDSRIEACKAELKRALASLPNGTRFNIIAYNSAPKAFQEKMTEIDPKTLKVALEWVTQLEAMSNTNIFDALKMAFSYAGRGATDRYYGSEVDTIFLLTDGSPTKPDGTHDSTKKILEGAQKWNPFKSVVIHCIGIGKGVNNAFLSQLAKENGGKFVTK